MELVAKAFVVSLAYSFGLGCGQHRREAVMATASPTVHVKAPSGTARVDDNDSAGRLRFYRRCIQTKHPEHECYSRLAASYLLDDELYNAITSLRKAIEHRPDEIGYYLRLADLYIRLGLNEQAKQTLTVVRTTARPNDERLYDVHVKLAHLFRSEPNSDRMISELEAARAISTKDPQLLFLLGMAYAKLKPPKKAESIMMLKFFLARGCTGKHAAGQEVRCQQAQATLTLLRFGHPRVP